MYVGEHLGGKECRGTFREGKVCRGLFRGKRHLGEHLQD